MGGINVLDLINPHLLKYQQEIDVGYSSNYVRPGHKFLQSISKNLMHFGDFILNVIYVI